MTGPITLHCGFCGEGRTPDRIMGGQSGAMICDDCAALAAMVFLARRAEAGVRLSRVRVDASAWSEWAQTAAGVPVIPVTTRPEPQA